MRILPLLGLLMAAGLASAAPVTVDCGRLLDVKAGAWRERVSITVDDGKVQSISPLAAGPGQIAGHIDLSAYSCLPGFIDMHVHLTGETQTQAASLRDELSGNPADFALRSVPYAERTLKAGFTTVRDLGSEGGLNVALKNAIANGSIAGPRMFTAGTAIATTGGHADPTNGLSQQFSRAVGTPGPVQGVINSPEQGREAVRARYKEGADLIKVTATGGVLSQ
ncbi:MAG: amidohydrolase, partial [Massilia sp.]|nr:amidohydrolase [Massilia sp.]